MRITPPWDDQTGNLFTGIVPYMDLHAAERAGPQPLPGISCARALASNDPYDGIAIRWPNIDVRRMAAWATAWSHGQQRFRSAHRHHLEPDRQVGHPHRRRNVLCAGHRQSALRYGAQHRRPIPQESNSDSPDRQWANAFRGNRRRHGPGAAALHVLQSL